MQNDEMFGRTIKSVLNVNEEPQPAQWAFSGLQHLFAMFGATALVPLLAGLPTSAALLISGIDTLLYVLITKAQMPAYLGFSFVFITPVITGLSTHSLGDILVTLFMSSVVYVIIGVLIKLGGIAWLMKLLPPVVVGLVIMAIGLSSVSTAVNMAMYENPGDIKGYNISFLIVTVIALLTIIVIQGFFKGLLPLILVLVDIIVGYVIATFMGIMEFGVTMPAKWIDFPRIYLPFKDYVPSSRSELVLVVIPTVFVTVGEHVGHQMVLNKIIGRNFFEKPGLDKSITGDGVSTMLAGIIDGPPSTTYDEDIGVLVITRVYSIYVIGSTAVIAIVLAFIGKLTVLISSMPTPAMGGVSILLFGTIATSGLRMLVESKVDFTNNRNLVIASVILVVGVGNLVFNLKEIGVNLQTEEITLAALPGIILNLILPKERKQNN